LPLLSEYFDDELTIETKVNLGHLPFAIHSGKSYHILAEKYRARVHKRVTIFVCGIHLWKIGIEKQSSEESVSIEKSLTVESMVQMPVKPNLLLS